MTSLLFPLMPACARACEREIRVMSESLSDPQKDAPLRPVCVSRLLTFFLLPALQLPVPGFLPPSSPRILCQARFRLWRMDMRPFLLTVCILQREALRDTRMKHKRRREPTLARWLRPYFLEMVQFYPDSHKKGWKL